MSIHFSDSTPSC